jgi:hypothetical protein
VLFSVSFAFKNEVKKGWNGATRHAGFGPAGMVVPLLPFFSLFSFKDFNVVKRFFLCFFLS